MWEATEAGEAGVAGDKRLLLVARVSGGLVEEGLDLGFDLEEDGRGREEVACPTARSGH